MNLVKLCNLFAKRAASLLSRAIDLDIDTTNINKEFFESGLHQLDDNIKLVLENYDSKFLKADDIAALQDTENGGGIYFELTTIPTRIQNIRNLSTDIITNIGANKITAIQKSLVTLNQQSSNILAIISKAKKFDATIFTYEGGDLAAVLQNYIMGITQALVAYFNWNQESQTEAISLYNDEDDDEEQVEKPVEEEGEGPEGFVNQWDLTKKYRAERLPTERLKEKERFKDWYRFTAKFRPNFMNTLRERSKQYQEKRRAEDPEFRAAEVARAYKNNKILRTNYLRYEKLLTSPELMAILLKKDPKLVEKLKNDWEQVKKLNTKSIKKQTLKRREDSLNKLLKNLGVTPDE